MLGLVPTTLAGATAHQDWLPAHSYQDAVPADGYILGTPRNGAKEAGQAASLIPKPW